MALKTLKPSLQTLGSQLRSYRAGDARIRGSSLQAIRKRILTRDCGVCQVCRVALATQVDHTVPLWEGGTETDGNRQSICTPCHEAKSGEEAKRRGSGSAGYRGP